MLVFIQLYAALKQLFQKGTYYLLIQDYSKKQFLHKFLSNSFLISVSSWQKLCWENMSPVTVFPIVIPRGSCLQTLGFLKVFMLVYHVLGADFKLLSPTLHCRRKRGSLGFIIPDLMGLVCMALSRFHHLPSSSPNASSHCL